jgi:preprotein translocase subunit SecA
VALEDQLWRIFNANMMENPALKMWPPMEEVTAKFLSRMIQKTQERIENHFFEARKHVLEYDDVLNAQREHIYGLRREVLLGKAVNEELGTYLNEIIADKVEDAWMVDEAGNREYDYSVLFEDLNEILPLVDYATVADLEKHAPGPDLVTYLQELVEHAYATKAEKAGDAMKEMERYALLRAVNDRWQDHLQTVEYIREGIGLRGYGQVDPLVAYKRETYDTFQLTLKKIRTDAAKMIFLLNVREESQVGTLNINTASPDLVTASDTPAIEAPAVTAEPGELPWPEGVDPKRVGRNEPCPCGSGLKFKECHYKLQKSVV